MAFADINEDNTSSLLRSKDAAFCGEKYQLFKDYLLQKYESVDFETFSKETLDELNMLCSSYHSYKY